MLSQIRSFLTVLDEGSLHRAAGRLNMSQSALSRQMQALEHEVGGRLLERTSTGVKPTNGGHALAARMRQFLADYDAALFEVRRLVRGEGDCLRLGYLASAFQEYLEPALRVVRAAHPELKLKLLDLFPAEQIDALRRGEIDLALVQQGADLLGRDFYTRRLATVGSIAALPGCHPLAGRSELHLAELKNETFVGSPDDHVPGYRQRVTQICRAGGKFRPRFLGHFQVEGVTGALAIVANEEVVALLPGFMHHVSSPGVVMVPVADPAATWDLCVAWQRGQPSAPLRTLLSALPFPS